MSAEESLQASPLFSARGICRHFRMGSRTISVLNGVDLDLMAGEFVAVLGSSGAGKSTLLHIMGLLDRPDAGALFFNGRNLAEAGESQRARLRASEVGFVFQDYFLLPEFSALENVLMPDFIAGSRSRARNLKPARKERAAALLERVGLGERFRHRPKELSGGERQRVALARALMNEPRIVLCDEPTGNLDSRTAGEIHELLLGLNENFGQTFLIVTHEQTLARIAKRRVQMVDGRILKDHEAEA